VNALILDRTTGDTASALRRVPLSGDGLFDEKWLQALLFAHPELLPLDQAEPGAGPIIPLCREFSIPRESGTVFLDILGATRAGRLVLIECKLWRNPQARREVIAQVLEYASLLRGWSFGDLTARLMARPGTSDIYPHMRKHFPDLDEARFVDAVSRSLETGDFHLVIAGDGIRSDLQAIAAHLNGSAMGMARLSLVEIQLWSDPLGRVVVVPGLSLRTAVVEQRVVVNQDGIPLRLAESAPATPVTSAPADPVSDAEALARRAANRHFWQRVIDNLRFDHPDQPPPRHGSNNWVRLDLPSPAVGITLYRTPNELGAFLRVQGEEGQAFLQALAEQADTLRAETGLDLVFEEGDAPRMKVIHRFAADHAPSNDEQFAWLCDTANRLVNLARPRIAQWNAAKGA
jgi:hypothetical protein